MSCYTTFFIISTDDFKKLQKDDRMSIDEVESGIELISINSRGDFGGLVSGMYKFDCYTEIQKNDWDKIYNNYIDMKDNFNNYLKKCETIYSILNNRQDLEDIYDEMQLVKQNLSALESYVDKLGMVFNILEDIHWRKKNYTIVAYEG